MEKDEKKEELGETKKGTDGVKEAARRGRKYEDDDTGKSVKV